MPMFRVTTVNLTREPLSARPDLGRGDLGVLDAAQLLVLLENFRRLDAIQNHDAAPQILVEGSARKFLIRTGQEKLYVHVGGDIGSSAVELDAAAIIQRLDASTAVDPQDAAETAARRKKRRLTFLAAGILIASVALDGFTVASVFHTESVNEQPAIVPVTVPHELTALQQSVIGRYATGSAPGDRVIEMLDHGEVRFKEIGTSGERLESADSYGIAHVGSTLCAVTRASGIIEVTDIDSLVFWHDVYRRVN